MKKLVILVFGILFFSLISLAVVYSANNEQQVQTQEEKNIGDSGIGQELSEQIRERKEELREGNYTGQQGQLLQVREMAHNLIQLRVRNVSADTDLNITQEQEQNRTRLKVKLSNGKTREIKIMPDTASETALARLRLRVCSEENNCTIVLKEVASKRNVSEIRAVYEIKLERQSKIMWLFKKRMQVRSQIDSENGKVLQIKKPWWAFLASEPEE